MSIDSEVQITDLEKILAIILLNPEDSFKEVNLVKAIKKLTLRSPKHQGLLDLILIPDDLSATKLDKIMSYLRERKVIEYCDHESLRVKDNYSETKKLINKYGDKFWDKLIHLANEIWNYSKL